MARGGQVESARSSTLDSSEWRCMRKKPQWQRSVLLGFYKRRVRFCLSSSQRLKIWIWFGFGSSVCLVWSVNYAAVLFCSEWVQMFVWWFKLIRAHNCTSLIAVIGEKMYNNYTHTKYNSETNYLNYDTAEFILLKNMVLVRFEFFMNDDVVRFCSRSR